jgi:uncharacterized membrane protein
MSAKQVGDHVEINPEEVRAGQTGNHVRQILMISTILAAICLGAAALMFVA